MSRQEDGGMQFHDRPRACDARAGLETLRTALRACGVLLLAISAAACGAGSDPASPPDEARSSQATLTLQPYFGELKTVRIRAGQTSLTMLFDTGGGATLVTPDVAGRLGCRPFGRDVGRRMSGEQVEFRQCEAFDLSAGDWRRPAAPVGVLDVNALLPPELPRLDGVLALDAFKGGVITLDWAAGLVTVHGRNAAEAVLRQHGLPVRIATGDNGRFFSAFVPVAATRGRLWFLLDSGNIAGTLVAQHVVRERLLTIGSEGDISLRVGPRPAFAARAATADLVIDGALGTAFLMRGPVALDLRARLSAP
jgi:hypothetical protein